MVYRYSEASWRDSKYNLNPTGKNRSYTRSTTLTAQEQTYIKAHEDEYRRTKLVDELIELWTGKTFQ
jgi:hypothetical protein